MKLGFDIGTNKEFIEHIKTLGINIDDVLFKKKLYVDNIIES